MIHPYIQPIETSVLLFPLAALALLIPVFAFQYRRFGHLQLWRWFVFNSFLLYALAAIAVVLLPLPEITADFCEVHKRTQQPQLTPFQFVADIKASWSLRHFQPAALLSNRAVFQALFNFLLLLPLGVYLAYYLRLGRLWAFGVAFGVSLGFEVTQYTGIFGLYPCAYRLFDVDDLLLNTAGAVTGYMIAPLFAFLPSMEAAKLPDDRADVSLMRRAVAFIADMVALSVLLEGLFFGIHAGGASYLHGLVSAAGILVWFIAVPAATGGFTPGKWLVRMKLVAEDGTAASPVQLAVRYGMLLLAPLSASGLIQQAGQRDGYFDGWWGIVHLMVMAVFFAGLFVWPIFRRDHRGAHDLLSKTHNVVVPLLDGTENPETENPGT